MPRQRSDSLTPGWRYRHWLIPALLGAGILLVLASPVEWQYWLDLARDHADSPWLIVLLIVLQIVLFSLALPASGMVWIVAPLYPPWLATLILTVGGSGGALGAYLLSRRFGQHWRERLEQRPLFALLQRQGGFATLFALRVMPGFPHSITNYSSGLLKLSLTPFLTSAVLGLACKTGLYSHAIWHAFSADEPADLARPGVIVPLLLLVTLAVAARLWQGRIARRRA